jgi:hypothetical protein
MGLLSTLQEKVFTSSLKNSHFSLQKIRKIPELPESLSGNSISYELIGGVVQAKLENGFYTIEEPLLSSEEKKHLAQIERGLIEVINVNENMNIEEYIEKTTRIIISELDLRLNETTMDKLLYHIYAKLVGLGKIEPIIRDPFITSFTFNGTISIQHKVYGSLQTDIMLPNTDLLLILRKLTLQCNEDLSPLRPNFVCSDSQKKIHIQYDPEDISNSQFSVTKIVKNYPTPIELANQQKVSPEMLAFLWMVIENNRNIFIVKDTSILHSLSFFVPPHTRILSNIINYDPNPFTRTYLGEKFGEEDYALIENWDNQETNGTLISSIDSIPEEGNIICYTDNGTITKINEDGKTIFQKQKDKFYHNLSESQFIASHGNRTILLEEFKLRTKLMVILIKGNQGSRDLRKVIRIYYDNPVQVLKQAGLL